MNSAEKRLIRATMRWYHSIKKRGFGWVRPRTVTALENACIALDKARK